MGPKLWRYGALVAVLCLAIAATAVGARRVPSFVYRGTTAQVNPDNGKKFAITFTLKGRTVSNVKTLTRDVCPDGSHLRVTQNAFKSVKLDRKGRFVLRAGPRTQPAVLKGRIIGKKASGTLSDRSQDPAGSGLCKANTTWSAKRR